MECEQSEQMAQSREGLTGEGVDEGSGRGGEDGDAAARGPGLDAVVGAEGHVEAHDDVVEVIAFVDTVDAPLLGGAVFVEVRLD